MSAGHVEVYESDRRGPAGIVRRYRWRRRLRSDEVADISPHSYVSRWSAKRGALRSFPGLPVVHIR